MKIEFTGATEGEAPLTWGQRLMWRAVHLMGPSQNYLNCPFVFPVYGRRDLSTVLDALRVLIERHETLRTTFSDAGQRISRDGVLEIELVEAGPERGLQVAGRVAGEMAHIVFDHGAEWPLRCAVVLKDGRPFALACVFTHLSVDYHALALLAVEWKALLKGAALPPVAWQPRDQATLEASDAWQARSARSIAYWRDVLADVPLDVFDHPPGEPEDPRFIEVIMESPALAVAATRLSNRLAVSSTSVVLAACAGVLGEVSARSRVVMQLVHNNRRDARTREMVGTVGQDALIVLDLLEPDFPGFCRTTHRAALQAYRNAHYDPVAMTAMREKAGGHDLDAFFNDRRAAPGWPALPPDADLSVANTRTYTENAWPGVRFKVFFTVGADAGTGRLSVIVDTAYLPRTTAERMLRSVEARLVGAV
ncbi:condensation domain-containing protein [Herbidospora yilanensis]|uniref:condensation domain-containing protein n=1 Tax=Herbidospora yilanensis TaxID=354426 RepID=UPI000783CD39|nr:condensation domain-containing protein [Herbidospora yilanensis]